MATILKEKSMTFLSKQLTNRNSSALSLKFFLKDHKSEMPLGIVINKNGNWQCLVSKFLRGGLNVVYLESSITLRNSKAQIEALEDFHGKQCSDMPMYKKYVYYSLEKVHLKQRVRQALELDLVHFQSKTA